MAEARKHAEDIAYERVAQTDQARQILYDLFRAQAAEEKYTHGQNPVHWTAKLAGLMHEYLGASYTAQEILTCCNHLWDTATPAHAPPEDDDDDYGTFDPPEANDSSHLTSDGSGV